MNIAGFQKMSLIDFPGVIASIVFTQGCAFRCSYCHNPELVDFTDQGELSTSDVMRYLIDHKALIEGVCVTGGEPTLQKDLPDFLLDLKKMGLLVKLDTTGINAAMLAKILAQKLVDYIAMDIKHVWEKYPLVVGSINDVSLLNCRDSFILVQSSGLAHEFRTTILPGVHTATDFEAIVGYLNPGETYYVQKTRFTKTLDPSIQKTFDFDPGELVAQLQAKHPDKKILLR